MIFFMIIRFEKSKIIDFVEPDSYLN